MFIFSLGLITLIIAPALLKSNILFYGLCALGAFVFLWLGIYFDFKQCSKVKKNQRG